MWKEKIETHNTAAADAEYACNVSTDYSSLTSVMVTTVMSDMEVATSVSSLSLSSSTADPKVT